jgi:hypothetical protein
MSGTDPILVLAFLGLALTLLSAATWILPRWKGFYTTGHIVVIESDDWGIEGITPEQLDAIERKGYDVRHIFTRYSIETPEDLSALYAVLRRHKDSRGRPAVFTANFVVANPDWDAIEAGRFEAYRYIPLPDRLSDGRDTHDLARAYREGMEAGVFSPQYHGRDHFNVHAWLSKLRSGDEAYRELFKLRLSRPPRAPGADWLGELSSVHVDLSTRPSRPIPLEAQAQALHEGLAIFERLFGYRPLSTVAPYGFFDETAERLWAEAGIRYIQLANSGARRLDATGRVCGPQFRNGERSPFGQVYLARNADLDLPGANVEKTFQAIEWAFFRGQPAVVSIHSVNYQSAIDPERRTSALANLDGLLSSIEGRFPDLVYLTSPELGTLMEGNSQAAPASSVALGQAQRETRPWPWRKLQFIARDAPRGVVRATKALAALSALVTALWMARLVVRAL